jgi:hypothetical protein
VGAASLRGTRAILALLGFVIISCSKITDPLAQPYVKEFRVTGTAPGQQATLTVTPGVAGRINVSGAVPVPTPCYTLEPDVAIRGPNIQMTLYARPTATTTACTQVLSVVTYQAVLGDFKPGEQLLIVSHSIGSGPVVDFTRGVVVQ